MGQVDYSLTGGNGGVFIDDTSGHVASTATDTSGRWLAIQAIETSVLDASEMGTSSSYACNIADFDADMTLTAGATLYGRFENCRLVSGKVVAYRA